MNNTVLRWLDPNEDGWVTLVPWWIVGVAAWGALALILFNLGSLWVGFIRIVLGGLR